MAKKNVEVLADVLAAMTNSTVAVEAAMKVKTIVRKKTQIIEISADLFAIDGELAAIDAATGKTAEAVKEFKIQRAQLARQRFATAFTNIPAEILKDRTDEGIVKLDGLLKDTRYGMYCAEYDNDDLDEEYTNKATGKKQPVRKPATKAQKAAKQDGTISFGTWPKTKRTFNIGAQLIGDVKKYGWSEIFKGTKVVPYAETQKWTVDENGEIEKAPASQNQGNTTPSGPKTGYELLAETIVALEKRLHRSDVDLTAKEGEAIADKAMLVISKAVAAAKAAKS